jgi:cobalamin synthase
MKRTRMRLVVAGSIAGLVLAAAALLSGAGLGALRGAMADNGVLQMHSPVATNGVIHMDGPVADDGVVISHN